MILKRGGNTFDASWTKARLDTKEKSMRYEFTITISAWGKNATEAWNEAIVALSMDPGCTPDESQYTVSENDEP